MSLTHFEMNVAAASTVNHRRSLEELLLDWLVEGPDPSGVQDQINPSGLIDDRAIRTADEDEFAHAATAAEVGNLAASSSTPLTIAVFGPWGSGKSGLLEM